MSGIDKLLRTARVYADLQGLELSTVSWRIFEDTKKLAALEKGADIQVRRAERAMQWFSANWPDGAAWPAEVDRPSQEVA